MASHGGDVGDIDGDRLPADVLERRGSVEVDAVGQGVGGQQENTPVNAQRPHRHRSTFPRPADGEAAV